MCVFFTANVIKVQLNYVFINVISNFPSSNHPSVFVPFRSILNDPPPPPALSLANDPFPPVYSPPPPLPRAPPPPKPP